jgi:reactive intermediate/imine deaminase
LNGPDRPSGAAGRRSPGGTEFKPVAAARPGVKRIVSTNAAPEAVGAYSQATETDDLVFTAGQIPLTPDGELLDDAPIDEQTQQALENVTAVLAEAGAGMDDVLKVTVYLDDIDDFGAMNETYETFFDDEPPARSAVGVDELPKGVGVEVEAIATK